MIYICSIMIVNAASFPSWSNLTQFYGQNVGDSFPTFYQSKRSYEKKYSGSWDNSVSVSPDGTQVLFSSYVI